MSARLRLVPIEELKRTLDTLREYGIDLTACSIDIRGDGVKVSPPAANQNTGDDLASYINRDSHRPQAGEKR